MAAPPPGFIEPCFATARESVPPGTQWVHEIKFDGYRAQAHLRDGECVVYSRRGYNWSNTFGSIASITDVVKNLNAETAVLDGEIVVLDERGIADFRLLQAEIAQGSSERFVYFVFDLLYLNGFDLRPAPLLERKRVLAELLGENPAAPAKRIRFSEHIEADGAQVFTNACSMKLEGIVCKDRNSPYRSGEQPTWIKVKCLKSDTFPIVAFVEKLGAKPRRIASLYLGRWEGGQLLYAGKAQTGFKQSMLYELRERLDPYIRKTSPLSVPVKKPKATWIEPVLQAEIEYSSVTSDNLLRSAVFKGIRDDLAPAQNVRQPTVRAKTPASGGGAPAPATPTRLRVPKENILQLLPDAVVPTKAQLANYWHRVAPKALTYLARRPLKLVRHTHDTTFYHMGPLPPIPESVHQLRIKKRAGGEGTRVWIDDLEGLLGLVEMGAVELHPWNATVDDIEHADMMVFDLDPGPGIDWRRVIDTAVAFRELLAQAALKSWPKLTGGKGVHIMVPLRSRMAHEEAHRFSRELAGQIAARDPARYTLSAIPEARQGKLFLDYLRNGRGTTAVGTYSPRARRDFPIAAPISWNQLERGIQPDAFSMDHPFRALKR